MRGRQAQSHHVHGVLAGGDLPGAVVKQLVGVAQVNFRSVQPSKNWSIFGRR